MIYKDISRGRLLLWLELKNKLPKNFEKLYYNVFCFRRFVNNRVSVPDATIKIVSSREKNQSRIFVECEKCKTFIPIGYYDSHYNKKNCVEKLTVGDVLFRDFCQNITNNHPYFDFLFESGDLIQFECLKWMIEQGKYPTEGTWRFNDTSEQSRLPPVIYNEFDSSSNATVFNSNEEAIKGLVTIWRNGVHF